MRTTRKFMDPRNTLNFFDSCAFSPPISEIEASNKILALHVSGEVILAIPKSVKDELDDLRTPKDVRDRANGMFSIFSPAISESDQRKKDRIVATVIGNGKRERYEADANHVFEVGRRAGYFITTDKRILSKRENLMEICGAVVCSPSQWLAIFEELAK